MATDRRPIYATLVFLGILLTALLILQPYSADWPFHSEWDIAWSMRRRVLHTASWTRFASSSSRSCCHSQSHHRPTLGRLGGGNQHGHRALR